MDQESTVLTVEEAAKRLKISRGKAYAMTQSGEIPVIHIGKRSVRVPADALDAWIKERTESAA